jgi:uncharacterized membrane protein (UPF0127 family)
VTASAPKPKVKRAGYLFGSFILLFLIFSVPFFYDKITSSKCVIYISSAKKCVNLETVNNDQSRQRGLSGRKNMSEDQGMLFVFEKSGRHCMWMKEMLFSLDIVWLDSDKKIVHIEKNVAPETYPKTFCPVNNAKYVIELNKGVADLAELKLGQQLNL